MGISVLLSVYKSENPKYFIQALRSIYNDQVLKPDEVVLIQDGPLTDDLYQVIDQFKSECPCLVTYAFQENQQLGRALAKGVELCSEDLIARMDTDDIARPNRLQLQYDYMMANPRVAVCGAWIEEFDDANPDFKQVKTMPEEHSDIMKYGRFRNPVNHMTVMIRRDEILKAGNYQHYPFLEDYNLWSRVMADGSLFHNIPEVLVDMRSGSQVYDRRGGADYTKRYMSLRKMQRDLGLLNPIEYIIARLLTKVMTLSNSNVRQTLYRKVLRR